MQNTDENTQIIIASMEDKLVGIITHKQCKTSKTEDHKAEGNFAIYDIEFDWSECSFKRLLELGMKQVVISEQKKMRDDLPNEYPTGKKYDWVVIPKETTTRSSNPSKTAQNVLKMSNEDRERFLLAIPEGAQRDAMRTALNMNS